MSNHQMSDGAGSVCCLPWTYDDNDFLLYVRSWAGVSGPGCSYPEIPVFRELLYVTTVVLLIAWKTQKVEILTSFPSVGV